MRHGVGIGVALVMFGAGVALGELDRIEPPRCRDYLELPDASKQLYVTAFQEGYLATRSVLKQITTQIVDAEETDERYDQGAVGAHNALVQVLEKRKLGLPGDTAQLLAARCYEPDRNMRRASLTLRDIMMGVE